jgi:glycosyltransferase involved in cell wall biosynthesis
MTRILMVSQPTTGGVFQHISDLVGGMTQRGHEVVLAAPTMREPPRLAAELVALEMVRGVAPATDLHGAAELARLIRRVAPTVVHAHSSKAGALARAARVARPSIPVVYTPHGYAFAGYFEDPRERARYRAVERALSPLATRVLCVCEAERDLAASVGPRSRCRVVYNGVRGADGGEALSRIRSLREQGPVVGVLTMLRPGKGIETLIDAMPAVLDRIPAASFVVAGDGPDRAELEARARERCVHQALHLVGSVDGPSPLMTGIDLFVSASWAESFPLNVLEAMAFGLPVVATDVGGTSEAVDDGHTGLLVPPRDANALARAIVSVLDDSGPGMRPLGLAGRARQQERFTVEAMIDNTLDVYAEVEH